MLQSLHIENIAVIEKIDIEFDKGFIVLTGETGAGKSILIDSINMILGERVFKDIIRADCQKAFVSAVFNIENPNILLMLDEFGVETDDDGMLIIQRDLTIDGKSTAKINGRPVTVGTLKEIGKFLINVHGQHDNHALLDWRSHVKYLDLFAKNDIILNDYQNSYKKINELKSEINSLNVDEKDKEYRIGILKKQIDEIKSANVEQDEYENLRKRYKLLQKSEKISAEINDVYELLINGEDNANDLLYNANNILSSISADMDEIDNFTVRLNNIYLETAALSDDLRDFKNNIEFDADEFEEIEERLDILNRLLKKYGPDISDILKFLEDSQKQLDNIEFSDEKIAALKKNLSTETEILKKKADILTKSRIDAGKILVQRVVSELKFLDMSAVRFNVDVVSDYNEMTSDGFDRVEFLIAVNVGEELKSMAKTASGGELSRIMLSLKNVLADKDEIETLIFDEVDTGVSGRAAQKIAIKLRQMSEYKQVVSVTHLAQIAAYATQHYLIYKETDDKRTYTNITQLNQEQRVNEMARIMSGIDITESVRQTANEMLINAEKYMENLI